MPSTVGKPRVGFCWWCGRKLWGNHYETVIAYQHERIVHKSCRQKVIDDDWHNDEVNNPYLDEEEE